MTPMDSAKQQPPPPTSWNFHGNSRVGSVDIKSADGKERALSCPVLLSLVAKPGIGPVKLRFNLKFGCTILAAAELSGGSVDGWHSGAACFLSTASAALQSPVQDTP